MNGTSTHSAKTALHFLCHTNATSSEPYELLRRFHLYVCVSKNLAGRGVRIAPDVDVAPDVAEIAKYEDRNT
jgi:hypothetical protein